MPIFFPSIPSDLHPWLLSQPLFYIATAPLHGTHINISPKGHPSKSLILINANKIAYLDATGSGCETISHVHENGRVTLMWCGFGQSPRIVRMFGRGRVHEAGVGGDVRPVEGLLGELGEGEERVKGLRSVIVIDVFKVQISCGFGVPLLSASPDPPSHLTRTFPDPPSADKWTRPASNLRSPGTVDELLDPKPTLPPTPLAEGAEIQPYFLDRPNLTTFGSLKKEAMVKYQMNNNCWSLDGLPGHRGAMRAKGLKPHGGRVRAWWGKLGSQWEGLLMGLFVGVWVGAYGGQFALLFCFGLAERWEGLGLSRGVV